MVNKLKEKINLETHAIGAVGLPLTPDNSIAVDKRIYPLGLPFLIKFVNRDLIKPVLSLDTGSAIVGSNRAAGAETNLLLSFVPVRDAGAARRGRHGEPALLPLAASPRRPPHAARLARGALRGHRA